uniref:Uncharacterized protein n=1 Tax=Anguilla anguilla TaxID=7936 RepID=A0A0E9SM18_ANGAN
MANEGRVLTNTSKAELATFLLDNLLYFCSSWLHIIPCWSGMHSYCTS